MGALIAFAAGGCTRSALVPPEQAVDVIRRNRAGETEIAFRTRDGRDDAVETYFAEVRVVPHDGTTFMTNPVDPRVALPVPTRDQDAWERAGWIEAQTTFEEPMNAMVAGDRIILSDSFTANGARRVSFPIASVRGVTIATPTDAAAGTRDVAITVMSVPLAGMFWLLGVDFAM